MSVTKRDGLVASQIASQLRNDKSIRSLDLSKEEDRRRLAYWVIYGELEEDESHEDCDCSSCLPWTH